ncbi:alpha/beta fold hydrolase [Dactylosporangium sucinum]|uniref:AB hydrolase-1 domain-containing protein n=1 Tax=Dactylosporangium sucinum TaxID=1424081 RepID=A0A917TYW5_9ACTN|nr:alpha/beta hydrolase [Dactylosporangium sucinum]GGM45849.1 hypothetical protein GCM10007977_054470 [Dactylosporangium sucinum]
MGARVRRAYLDGPDGQIHVRVAGEAGRRPLLCLHLTPGSGRMYEALLGAMGEDRVAIAPDTPGYGASDGPASAPTIPYFAEAMERVMDHFGWDSVDLLGYHTGSKIAVALALAQPRRVHRLTLISAPSYTPDEEAHQRDTLAVEYTPREDGGHLLDHWRGLLRWRGPGQRLDLIDREFGEQQRGGTRRHWGYRAAFAYPHRTYLPQVTQPVLVLCPDDDLREPTLRSRALVARGELRELPGWGHGLLDVRTEEFAELLRDFFDVP